MARRTAGLARENATDRPLLWIRLLAFPLPICQHRGMADHTSWGGSPGDLGLLAPPEDES